MEVAEGIKKGILEHLFDKETNTFYKGVVLNNGKIVADKTIDFSGVYGLYKFKVLKFDDPLLMKAFEVMVDRLKLNTEVGGISRYEGDVYHTQGGNVPPCVVTFVSI